MNPQKVIALVLVAAGSLLMLASCLAGLRIRKKLPGVLQENWQLLLLAMALFFCGYLLCAWMLITDFTFPGLLIGASILLGGLFALLVLTEVKAAAGKIQQEQSRLDEVTALMKHLDNELSQETQARHHSEHKLRQSNNFHLRDLFEIMDEVQANRDQYTFDHALQVAEISKMIGKKINLSDDELESLELGCLVHDIGKTAIPDDVLLKPAQFNYQDKDIMNYHPLIGAKLVARHIQDDRITDIILNHHERLDGSGYPAGIKGEEISLFARIVAVADIYEALVTQRPYKKPVSRDQALRILRQEASKGRLDRKIVKILVDIAKSLPTIKTSRRVTAGFMENVELFRSKSYYQEPLTGFYNYRYLLVLEDARVLQKQNSNYDLVLLRFPDLLRFQHKTGYMLSDQIIDEFGQNIQEMIDTISQRREHYQGSIMLFRKGYDYLIYAESDEGQCLSSLTDIINRQRQQTMEEWQLKCEIFTLRFDPGFPMEKALHHLFVSSNNLPD